MMYFNMYDSPPRPWHNNFFVPWPRLTMQPNHVTLQLQHLTLQPQHVTLKPQHLTLQPQHLTKHGVE
ncbi:hypothetical protein E2C01_007614 [Portunus trituberculatus]|uniref:Uncharacterized protein n=1 Tax=Portunus trituberculatus TaxID=210409 RepID=A0A5B7CZW3_PORTR|nr:hypothetical protein [Portunus trituberculatus]